MLATAQWSIDDQPTVRIEKIHARQRVTSCARLRHERNSLQSHRLHTAGKQADELPGRRTQKEARTASATIQPEHPVRGPENYDGRKEPSHRPPIHRELGEEKTKPG